MLGVRSQVCNEFPYVELERPTLISMILKRQYIFYKNCTVDRDWPLQRYIIRKATDCKCPYIMHYIKLRNECTSATEVTERCLMTMKETILKKANEGKSRYVSYLELNPNLIRSTIYSTYIPTIKLHHTTQLRMISHHLRIETGRHKRPVLPRKERLCICGSVETEYHFLFECHMYYHIRAKYSIHDYNLGNALNESFTCDYVHDLIQCRKIFISTK